LSGQDAPTIALLLPVQ